MKLIITAVFLFIGNCLLGQTLNDSCKHADEITIGSNGWGEGVFYSKIIELGNASKEIGESFHPLIREAGMDRKSVWYKFTISTSRKVTIALKQKDTMIAQNAVGFTVYYTSQSETPPNLGEVSLRLPTINKFGSSQADCLQPGDYLIQVCARSNVTDSVWLEAKVERSNVFPFDNKLSAYQFGTLTSLNNTVDFDVGCLSVEDSSELMSLPVSNAKQYSQSAWFVMKTNVGIQQLSISLMMIQGKFPTTDSLFWGIRVYKGNVLSDSLVLLNTLSKRVGNGIATSFEAFVENPCEVEPDRFYTIQLMFNRFDEYKLRFNIRQITAPLSKAAYPPQLPAAYKLGVLPNAIEKTVEDYLSCNASMSTNACGSNVYANMIDSFMSFRSMAGKIDTIYTKDTFDLNTWLTFEISQPSQIEYKFNPLHCNSAVAKFVAKLFSGDINNNCQLQFLQQVSVGNKKWCIAPGKYSIQIIARSFKSGNTACFENMAGGLIRTTLLAKYSAAQPIPTTHRNPDNAENLGDITSLLINGGTKTSSAHFLGGSQDTLTILGSSKIGHFAFVKFYIGTPLSFEALINNGGARLDQYYLLKGEAGKDSLIILPYYKGLFQTTSQNFLSTNTCFNLDTGWYTLIGYKNRITNCEPNIYMVSYNLRMITNTVYSPQYNTPSKAYVFNNNQPMSWNESGGGLSRNVYASPVHYFGCAEDTSSILGLCSSNGLPLYVNYYVVKIKHNGSFVKFRDRQEEVYQSDFSATYSVIDNQYLSKGDIRTNPQLMNDSSARISSCAYNLSYCNLDSGIYTLALVERLWRQRTLYVVIDKMYDTNSDHFKDAKDIGLLQGNNIAFNTPIDFMGCGTSNLTFNPTLQQPNLNKNALHNDYNISKDLWYTFLVKGSGNLYVQSKYNSYTNAYRPTKIELYGSDLPSGLSFQELKALNKIDSSALIRVNPTQNPTASITYNKSECDTMRYFVRIIDVTPFEENYQVYLNLRYNEINTNPSGDFCSSAIPLSLNQFGSTSASAIVNCCTVGESFGEDGLNLGCLGKGDAIKTAWFKFTYTGADKADIVFQLENNSNVNSTKIAYRVLYGSCNAMTAGPCVGSGFSSFKLDCMPPGEYFIQVALPIEATGSVKLTTHTLATTYPVCKPFDLQKPFANFYPKGGCESGNVQFVNLSTQGVNIKYVWNFGNGITSNDKTPSIQYTQKYNVDTFWVSLEVTDTVLNKKDSTTIPVYVFYNSLQLDAGQDLLVHCNQSNISLHATTNYSLPLFEWSPPELLDNPYLRTPRVIEPVNQIFVLKMTVENCNLFDTVMMRIVADDNIQGDSVLHCDGEGLDLTAPSGYYGYLWSTGVTANKINVDKTGMYWLRMQKNACVVYDTILISGDNPIGKIGLGEDRVICNGQSTTLVAPDFKALWSTGDTTKSITINSEGLYWLMLQSGDCKVHDTILIKEEELMVNLGVDSSFCEGDGLMLMPEINGYVTDYLWSNGFKDSFIYIVSPGIYHLQVSNNRCSDVDTILVSEKNIPHVKLPDDTVFCSSVNIQLSPGNTYERYLWSSGDTSANLTIQNQGVYWLRTWLNGCSSIDTIHIGQSNRTTINIGSDTTFCGSFIWTIDGGEGKFWKWSPTGETTRFIQAEYFGTYTLHLTDSNNCVFMDTLSIIQDCHADVKLFIPNAFTVDGNQLNDHFKAQVTGVDWFEMKVFNRWGQMVFSSTNSEVGWDGTYQGKPLSQDVYIWIIEYRPMFSEQKKSIKGNVTLLK